MTAADWPDDDEPALTESMDSVLVEFSDEEMEFTRRPVRDIVLRHLPSWLREAARLRLAPTSASAGLAICLCDQARLHTRAGRPADALARLTEAQQIFESAGDYAGLADCLHLVSQAHESLGETEQAIAALRREEELRRRLAA